MEPNNTVGTPEELMKLAGADNFEDAFVNIAGGAVVPALLFT